MKYNIDDYQCIIDGKIKSVAEMNLEELQQELCVCMDTLDAIMANANETLQICNAWSTGNN